MNARQIAGIRRAYAELGSVVDAPQADNDTDSPQIQAMRAGITLLRMTEGHAAVVITIESDGKLSARTTQQEWTYDQVQREREQLAGIQYLRDLFRPDLTASLSERGYLLISGGTHLGGVPAEISAVLDPGPVAVEARQWLNKIGIEVSA